MNKTIQDSTIGIRQLVGLLMLVLTLTCNSAQAGPYEPAAGQPGSTAIRNSDAAIAAWASGVGSYNPGPLVGSPFNDPLNALGFAEGNSFDIVSLGAGGYIDLTFSGSIYNGPGWDFLVFENGFSDTFLELARVQVSSNGTDFFEFPGISLTQNPVGSFGTIDPTNIANTIVTTSGSINSGFASKYRQGWGTPFDLDWFVFTGEGDGSLLDVNNISTVRILDIIGDGSFTDLLGNPVFDPFPETCCGGGFDLDGVGVRYLATSPVPLPASIWLLGSAIVGLAGVGRRTKQTLACKI